MTQNGALHNGPGAGAGWALSPAPDSLPAAAALDMPVPAAWRVGAAPQPAEELVRIAPPGHGGQAIPSVAPEVAAARTVAAQFAAGIAQAPAFGQLDPARRSALMRDLNTIQQALYSDDSERPTASSGSLVDHAAVAPAAPQQPLATAQETPADLMRRRLEARQGSQPHAPAAPPSQPNAPAGAGSPVRAATETLAGRAGALIDEINFPAFVAGLVHGVFDAIVDATIRQMESFASLVSAVAKDVDQFTRENITNNQVRDWLVERYPGDLALDPATMRTGEPQLRQAASRRNQEDSSSPAWLADFGMEGAELNEDTIEQQLVPAARRVVGEQRLQMLAAMVLMGMSRVVVRDGTISARVKFRAAARDHGAVDYATSQDPGGGSGWGARGSSAYDNHATMVSTVTANVQTDTLLDATLYGEVKINFASETLPLDRFVDPARLALLQRNARPVNAAAPAGQAPSQPAGPPGAQPPSQPLIQPPAPQAPAPQAPAAQAPAAQAPAAPPAIQAPAAPARSPEPGGR